MKVNVCRGGIVPFLHTGSSSSHIPTTTSFSSCLHKACLFLRFGFSFQYKNQYTPF